MFSDDIEYSLAVSPRRTILTLTTLAQRRAIASPLRMELLEATRYAGRASVSDLARLTSRRPTAVHYHVAVLQRSGLLVVAERRRAGKRTEAVYRVAADAFAVPAKAGARRSSADGSHTIAAMLRLTQREAARSLASFDVRPVGPSRNFHVRRLRAPLRPAALVRANSLLDQLERLFTAEFEHAAEHADKAAVAPATAPTRFALTLALTFAGPPSGSVNTPASGTAKKSRRIRP